MNYIMTHPDFQEAKKSIADYPYGLVYELSSVTLCRADAFTGINWDEVTEARFFSEGSELHLICGEENLAVLVSDNDADKEHIIARKYELANRFKAAGKAVIVKQYLKPDSDGQMTVAVTRLAGIIQEV